MVTRLDGMSRILKTIAIIWVMDSLETTNKVVSSLQFFSLLTLDFD